MDDVEAKRVFDDRRDGAELLVAGDAGVVSVSVSADRVGRFAVAHRCTPTALAAHRGYVAVATDDEVLVREPGTAAFEPTGFGAAAAVGIHGGHAVAAAPDGRAAELNLDSGEARWSELGRVDGPVRAIDGGLLAASTGIYRLPGLDYAGLDDAHDVAAAGPLAATGDGLFSLGNGWMCDRDGDFRVVATDGERAHAASTEALFERRSGRWGAVELPADASVAAACYGEVPYVVTADGVLLAEGEGGWRTQPLGVSGVVGCVVG